MSVNIVYLFIKCLTATFTASGDHVSSSESHSSTLKDAKTLDNSFMQYRRLCSDIEKESSHNKKTKLVETYIKYGNGGG